MKIPKIRPRSEHLLDFFEEGLTSLGAVCERSWHDRLEILAEGEAARLWQKESDLFSGAMPAQRRPAILRWRCFRAARSHFSW
jgi:hypothetical protein